MKQNELLTTDLRSQAKKIISNYEKSRSALLPILHLIQDTYGYISEEAEREVSDFMKIPIVEVKEVITFYTLYRSKPCAKYEFEMCRTLSCSLRGGEDILAYLKKKLGIEVGGRTADGEFGLSEVECLGACDMAPMAQLNKAYIGPLTQQEIDGILKEVSRQ